MTTTTRTRMQQALFEMFADTDETEDETMTNLRHFFQHGDMTSGFGQLIYYSDTNRFMQEHQDAIDDVLTAMQDDYGYTSLPAMLAENGYTKEATNLYSLTCGMVWAAAERTILDMIAQWESDNDPQDDE